MDEHAILARGPLEPPDPPECKCGLIDGCPECAPEEWEWETDEEYRARRTGARITIRGLEADDGINPSDIWLGGSRAQLQ